MMGIREKINQNPVPTAGVVIGVAVIALVFMGWWTLGNSTPPAPTSAFYTDDDGQTFFKDSINKVSPFDRDGKQAYRADVFRVEGGEPFVGLLYRHNATGRQQMEDYIATRAKDPTGGLRQNIEFQGLEVKRVGAGDRAWIPLSDPRSDRLIDSVRGPNGEAAQRVEP